MRMAKKNPNIFTIGFKKGNPAHQKVVDILNGTEEKAELIAAAILQYMGMEDGSAAGMDADSLRPLMESLIREEVQKALQQCHISPPASETLEKEEEIMDISSDGTAPALNENLLRNITSAMDAFRHI